jgi:hypothetical protein
MPVSSRASGFVASTISAKDTLSFIESIAFSSMSIARTG